MANKRNSILSATIFIGIVAHFWLGYFHWDLIDGIAGTDILYSITGYFLMDTVGLTLFILCDHFKIKSLKAAGIMLMGCATYYIYKEFEDPYNWRVNDYKVLTVLLVSFVNLFFIFYFTDLIRKL